MKYILSIDQGTTGSTALLIDENLNIGSLLYSDLDDSRIFFKKEKLFAEPYNSLQDFEEQYVPSACQ